MAVFGEIIGTGIIGAIVSYPVMTFIWGREGLSWLFYVPSFICGTLIGGSIAYFFLRKMVDNGMLTKMQEKLGSPIFADKSSVLSNAISIAAFGPVLFVVFLLLPQIFHSESIIWKYLAYGSIAGLIIAGIIYFIVKSVSKKKDKQHKIDKQNRIDKKSNRQEKLNRQKNRIDKKKESIRNKKKKRYV